MRQQWSGKHAVLTSIKCLQTLLLLFRLIDFNRLLVSINRLRKSSKPAALLLSNLTAFY